MRTSKRVLSLLLVIVLLLSIIPVNTFAGMKFQDVAYSSWYYDSVMYVYRKSLMQGTHSTKFSPDSELTRGMFVTILGRLDGVEKSEYSGKSFEDVSTKAYYGPYVKWAADNGIVMGITSTKFKPDDNVTREQMATMIARYVSYKDIYLPDAESTVSSFKDYDQVSKWAREGLELMRRTGLIVGYKGKFNPTNTATRAEAATLFMRLCEAIQKSRIIPEGAIDLGDGDSMYEVSDDRVSMDEETFVTYVNDIVLVFLADNVTWQDKEELAASVNGRIAGDISGAIEILQIEVEESSLTELENLADVLMQDSRVNYACMDVAYPEEIMGSDEDELAWWWDSDSKWWYDAVDAGYVNEHYKEYLDPVTVGVIDSGIDSSHSEFTGKISFASSYYRSFNTSLINEYIADNSKDRVNHGTHVTGLICAADNGKGITGVAPDSDVIFASWRVKNIPQWYTSLSEIYALQILVEKGAKVVNCSFGCHYLNQDGYKNLQFTNPEDYKNVAYEDYLKGYLYDVRYSASASAAVMCDLINNNYDFIVVHGAGNGVNNSGPGVDASLGGLWAAMDENNCSDICNEYGVPFETLEKHYLVVTSIIDEITDEVYTADPNRNYGDNVDICAPGSNIYSTVYGNEYDVKSGTSMAAPIVTGVVALAWSAYPQGSAEEIYDIVTHHTKYTAEHEQYDVPYPVVNAKLAVEAAIVENHFDDALYEYLHNVFSENIDEQELGFYFDDYDGDGYKEAFAVTGERDGQLAYNVKVYHISRQGYITHVSYGMNLYGCYSHTLSAGNNKYLVWSKNAGGSGSTAYLFGVKFGRPHQPQVSGKHDHFYYDESGVYVGTTTDFSNGYHEWVPTYYTYDNATCEFIEIEGSGTRNWNTFLKEKTYLEYWDVSHFYPSRYAYLDIDKDGVDEMIVRGSEGSGFFGVLVFAKDPMTNFIELVNFTSEYDNGDTSNVRIGYGVPQYSEKYQALIVGGLRPDIYSGSTSFYLKKDMDLVYSFSVGYSTDDNGKYYFYSDPSGMIRITETEKDRYLFEPSVIDFIDLP